MQIKQTEDELYEQIDKATEHDASLWRGMTYEQGVEAALRWVLDGDNPPMDEED